MPSGDAPDNASSYGWGIVGTGIELSRGDAAAKGRRMTELFWNLNRSTDG
jgi:hypothetical protein